MDLFLRNTVIKYFYCFKGINFALKIQSQKYSQKNNCRVWSQWRGNAIVLAIQWVNFCRRTRFEGGEGGKNDRKLTGRDLRDSYEIVSSPNQRKGKRWRIVKRRYCAERQKRPLFDKKEMLFGQYNGRVADLCNLDRESCRIEILTLAASTLFARLVKCDFFLFLNRKEWLVGK